MERITDEDTCIWGRPLEEDGDEDIKAYNDELAKLGNPKWFEAPWLFAECYLYRSVLTIPSPPSSPFFTVLTCWFEPQTSQHLLH
jgi:hypothetical protein